MLRALLSGAQRQQYLSSSYKPRMDHVGQALQQRGYLAVVVTQHVREWLRLARDFETRDEPVPSQLSDPRIHAYLQRWSAAAASASRQRCIRAAIRVFLETDAEGQCRRRMPSATPPPTVPWFEQAAAGYWDFLHLHGRAHSSALRRSRYHLQCFATFLDAHGLTTLPALRAVHVRDFSLQLPCRTAATRQTYSSTLRSFLRWAYCMAVVPQDLSPAVLKIHKYRWAGLPDVLTSAEIERILAMTDRHTAIGRRDLAVLLLAARYGLRASDIRQLAFEHLDWRQGRLMLRQSKTGRLLELPLLRDVATAIAAYLRDGRPRSRARAIFVRHRAPYEALGPNNNFCTVMRAALARAGLASRSGRRGLYLFRHSLATHLLATGHPVKTISDILGHATSDVTLGYAKVELAGLRAVAIAEREITR